MTAQTETKQATAPTRPGTSLFSIALLLFVTLGFLNKFGVVELTFWQAATPLLAWALLAAINLVIALAVIVTVAVTGGGRG